MRNEEFSTAHTLKAELRQLGLRILVCAAFFILHSSLFGSKASAQYNTDRLVTIGRSALYYEDYVLAIQYFNQAITAKPYLYEPWFLRGVAKYYLDDFAGAEGDCTSALERNPYVSGIYELRGLTRIQQEKFAEAIGDYDQALRLSPTTAACGTTACSATFRIKTTTRHCLNWTPCSSAGASMRRHGTCGPTCVCR